MTDRFDSTLAAWIALLLFGAYLLSFSGRFYSQDSMLMFSVTESYVKRGEFGADQMWTIYKARDELGLDGEAYSKTGYGASLLAAPLYALARALPDVGLTQSTMLTSSIVIALTGALLFLSARRLKFSRGASAVTALLFGLATPAWVYAKQFWSEPYALFTLFAGFFFLLRFRATATNRDAVLAGVALGLAVATRLTNAALVPFFAWYGFVNGTPLAALATASNPSKSETLRAGRVTTFVDELVNRLNVRGLIWFSVILALFVVSIGWYNWARYGSPLNSGYRPDETFSNPFLLGLYGLLFSPGKGLFVYVPFLAALPWAMVAFYRAARRELFLLLALFAIYLLLFSTWYYWWGGTNWGPRFLVPLLPFVVLLIAPAVELALQADCRRRAQVLFSGIFLALCALGVAIEILGVSVPSLAYRARLLRFTPDADWNSIFYPQSSPLVGSLDLLRPGVLDFGWIRVLDNVVSVDWLVIVLTAALVATCAAGLILSLRHARRNTEHAALGANLAAATPATRRDAAAPIIVLALFIALALFSLYRYTDDFRFGGSDGYRSALQAVQRDAQAQDVMILDDDTFTPFFLNENRNGTRWYGLSRDPSQWDDATRALLGRLSQQYSRLWLVIDDSSASLPDPTRDWLGRSLPTAARYDFGDGVHLILYSKGTDQ